MNKTLERKNSDKEIQQVLNELFGKTAEIRPLIKNITNSESSMVEKNNR